jgi:glycosyltransferase involved in cell wall biosynthesis
VRAALLLPTFASRDAIGTDVIAMAACLREHGIETRIFSEGVDAAEEKSHPVKDLIPFAGGPDDLVIYHYSIGWPLAIDVLRRARGLRVVRYHNITPPEFFEGVSPVHVETCGRGRAEIPIVANLGCELYLADSAYNGADLVAAGAPADRIRVLPPFHRVEALLDRKADLRLLDALSDGTRNVLMLGRIAPNKGHLDLVDAFAAYVDRFADDARLVIVGKSDPNLRGYEAAIRERAAQHNLGDRLHWIAGASETALKSLYLASHALAMLSRHEGFCVPLVEAMAFGLPIVGRASTAIPETVGEAGVLWDSDDPLLYAASLDRVFGDAELRTWLEDAGRARYRDVFAPAHLRAQFAEMLGLPA